MNEQNLNPPAPATSPAATGSADRVQLRPEQLDRMMPPGEYVHTFIQAGGAIIGCDVKRTDILKAAEIYAELSGPMATSMHHGAAVWDEDSGRMFVETLPNAKADRSE